MFGFGQSTTRFPRWKLGIFAKKVGSSSLSATAFAEKQAKVAACITWNEFVVCCRSGFVNCIIVWMHFPCAKSLPSENERSFSPCYTMSLWCSTLIRLKFTHFLQHLLIITTEARSRFAYWFFSISFVSFQVRASRITSHINNSMILSSGPMQHSCYVFFLATFN